MWWVVDSTSSGALSHVVGRDGDEYADGTRIPSTDVQAEAALCAGSFLYELVPVIDGPGIARVEVGEAVVSGAPAMWFCWVHEPTANPVAANLVAYADDRMPQGTIITNIQFASMMNTHDGQVGAIRWYPDGGLIHQIYVAPERRRENIGSMLIYAAAALHVAHGWAGRLHGDGRRTDLGERFAAGIRHGQRVAALSQLQPGMD